jgi:putative FmdB family regulatory protein
MPTYEYRCENCGDFEETQRISDPPLQRCPTCRRKVRRLISSTSFQLKGSGWYVTDYARGAGNGGKAESKGETKPDASASDGNGSGKTESKTESKAESKPVSSGTTEKSS